jgi:hypothetical protein
MPSGASVRPEKWSGVVDLYDDGVFSAIWGSYDESRSKALGVRWNGGNDSIGFPGQGQYPTWFVEPDFLTESLLHGLLDRIVASPQDGDLQAVLRVLAEAKLQRRAPSQTP